MSPSNVSKSYEASGPEAQREAYDAWAASYEPDLCAMGYRIPAVLAAVAMQHLMPGDGPVLDAGCGGGIQAEALALAGIGPLIGLDLSEGMLAVAKAKSIYADLICGPLGGRLDFPDDHFAGIISAGTITPRHAPPESFDDLIRVARPGAPIIFSLRDDPAQDPAYPAALTRLTNDGSWEPVFTTDSFKSMPYGEPDITHRVHVFRAAGS